jgi:integrase
MWRGTPTRVLQSLAGHASPTVTLGTYSHPTDRDLQAAMTTFGNPAEEPEPDA